MNRGVEQNAIDNEPSDASELKDGSRTSKGREIQVPCRQNLEESHQSEEHELKFEEDTRHTSMKKRR